MTTMISELYEALINAGATEEKAREAAVALACMDAGGRAAPACLSAGQAGGRQVGNRPPRW